MAKVNPEENIIDEQTSEQKQRLKIWDEGIVEVSETHHVKRLSMRNVGAEIADAFNFNTGFLHTMKGLTIEPVKTIRSYLDVNRLTVTSPIRYFIIVVGVSLFIANYMGFFDAGENSGFAGFKAGLESSGGEMPDQQMEELNQKLQYAYDVYFVKYQNVWSIITIFFSSIFSFLFFRKSGFNFAENMAINSYAFTHTYIPFTILVILGIANSEWLLIYFLIYFGYLLAIYKGLFNQSWIKTIFKTIFSVFISWFLFMLLIMLGLFIIIFNTIGANPM